MKTDKLGYIESFVVKIFVNKSNVKEEIQT